MANEKGWRRRPKDREYTLDFAATLGGKLVAGCVEINQCVVIQHKHAVKFGFPHRSRAKDYTTR